MSPCDFLHKNAETPLCDCYMAAGALCRLTTNSEDLLAAARDSFLPVDLPSVAVDLSIRFWIDHSDKAQPPWPNPYVRGLDHLVFAGFNAGSSFVADLSQRRVIGRFSPAMAADTSYWKTVIFPMLLTVTAATVGIAELHCACVARGEEGLLLAGPSGSGKSTLALALAQIGFSFLSDDRTFCSLENDEVRASGLLTRLKLRREAVDWFPGLRNELPIPAQAAQPDRWFDPEQCSGVKRARRCRPSTVIFLERNDTPEFQLSPLASTEVLERLSTGLMPELPDASAKRLRTVEKVARAPGWLLQYGGKPQAVAAKISEHLAGLRHVQRGIGGSECSGTLRSSRARAT
jgi:hypothetical protein